jgi:two-component system, LytTR family, response regulator
MARTRAQSLSALVADDERPARRRLVELLRRYAFVGAIHEAANGVEAVTIIEERSPDLVLLDIQMPELDGFGVIANVGAKDMPATIFVTAYDQYAIRAFEANALDYLLKPFSDERFEQALDRARSRVDSRSSGDAGDGMDALFADEDAGRRRYLDRLVVKGNDCVRLLRSSEIDWIEAQGVYVSIHVGRTSLLHRASLSELARRLNPLEFTRIHRSAIVAIERITRLEPHTHGEYIAVLADGTRLRVSRTYRAVLEARLGQSL